MSKNKSIYKVLILSLLTVVSSLSYSFADYAPGVNVIPLSQIFDGAKTGGWKPVNTMHNDTTSKYFNAMSSLAPNNAVSLTLREYNFIDIAQLRTDLNKRDIGNPLFKDAYLQEMHQKGLLVYTKLNLTVRAPQYYGNCYDYQGVSMAYGLYSNSPVISATGMYGATPFTFNATKQLFGSSFLSDSGLFIRGYRDTLFPATSVTLQINMQQQSDMQALVGVAAGRYRYDSYHTSNQYLQMSIDLNTSSVEVVILPDTSQVGKIYDTVQSIPITLNNTVNQINTSLANQPLALVYIPNNAQRTTQLAKLGLATNITTDGIYKSSDGFKYKVVLYTPPTNVDQLNMT